MAHQSLEGSDLHSLLHLKILLSLGVLLLHLELAVVHQLLLLEVEVVISLQEKKKGKKEDRRL